MTLISYLDVVPADGHAVRLHGVDVDSARRLTKVIGFPGLGASGARDATQDRASYHGSVTRSRWRKPNIVTLEGIIEADNGEDLYTQLDTVQSPFLDAVDAPIRLLTQRGDTGVEIQADARMTDEDFQVDILAGDRIAHYHVSVRMDDPRWYTQELFTSIGGTIASAGGDTMPATLPTTFSASAQASASVNNTGTRPTPPILRFYGMSVDAYVVLVGTDQRLALKGTIGAGDYLEIDVKERAVLLNGTSPADGYIDSSTTTWFELPRGTSTLKLFALSNDVAARCDVLYRPSFA